MSNYRILIVEDNNENLEAMKAVLLQLNNCEILTAMDGNDALRIVQRDIVNLVLMDISLPDFSGYEVAKLIKSRKSTMGIPIVFLSGIFKSVEHIEMGFKIGAIDFLFKPINAEELLSKINYYICLFNKQNELTNELIHKNKELEKQNLLLKQAKNELKRSEKEWRYLGENIPDTVVIMDIKGNILFSNKFKHIEAVNVFDYTFNTIDKKQIEIIKNNIQEVQRSKTTIEFEISNREKSKYDLYRMIPIFDEDEEIVNIMIIISDITNKKLYEKKIEYLTFNDTITGLKNRNFLEYELKKLSKQKDLPLSIMMADMNGLKLVNDAFGHDKGDELLKDSANLLTRVFRKSDIVGRYGGDEFLVLMPNTTYEEANKISSRINNESALNDGLELKHNFAFGVATMEKPEEDLKDIITKAEDRMYRNKLINSRGFRSSIIQSLKNALQEKDFETKEHTDRMEILASKMANRLTLSNEEQDNLALLTSLHDIGKVGISDNILLKKGSLNEEEWEKIKRHPEMGYNITKTIPQLAPISELVLHHHEWWNGMGYPEGLVGETIPLLSRVITIIDAYDVMTNKRPYKKAISHQEALKELRKFAGIQFDSELVGIFCGLNFN